MPSRCSDLREEPAVITAESADFSGTERLAAEIRDNPLPCIIYRAEGFQILEANPAALELFEYSKPEILQRSMLDLFAPEDAAQAAALPHDLRKPLYAWGPASQISGVGRMLMVRVAIFAQPWSGCADARLALLEDNTAACAAQESIRASEERFRDLFENASDAIFVHDMQGKLLAVNRATEELTAYSRWELLGETFDRLVGPEAAQKVRDTIRAHLGGRATHQFESEVISRVGDSRYVEVSTRVLYGSGQALAVQGVAHDITERKLAQERLVEFARQLQIKNDELSTALRLAREATQLKEQFLANTSHELRTPMNGIMGMINLLKTTQLGEDQLDYVSTVSQCANDLLTIINDILDLSQIEAGRLALNDEPFDPEESLNSIIKLLRVRASGKNLELTYTVERRFPAYVRGDCVRFRQVLTNLIANAIKFTPSGTIETRLKLAGDGERLRCEVADTGIGVSEGACERIFEAFVQADGTTKRRFGGTGLGLTICKQLVETMGGRIGMFNNRPGPGCTFWFELPLRTGTGASCDPAAVVGATPLRA